MFPFFLMYFLVFLLFIRVFISRLLLILVSRVMKFFVMFSFIFNLWFWFYVAIVLHIFIFFPLLFLSLCLIVCKRIEFFFWQVYIMYTIFSSLHITLCYSSLHNMCMLISYSFYRLHRTIVICTFYSTYLAFFIIITYFLPI